MAITEVLRLVLDADMRAGVAQVERFGDTAKRELTRSEQSLDKWGNRLTNVGAGMVGFGTAALFGLGKAAQASEEAQLSVVKLENTIGNMPKLAGQSSKQFLDLADSIQDVTAADADAIVAGEAMLGTFGLTADQIKGITPLVVDYARKFGTDLVTANTQVGKALDGQVGALKRNGVSIDENLFKTDRYAAVTQALRDQVGGFAEQEGRTFAGSLERLKNQMGDVVEGVGVGAVDAFGDLIGVVQPAIDGFNDFDPGVQSTIGKVGTFGSVALIAAGGASVLIGQIVKAKQNFSAAWQAVSGLSGRTDGLAGSLTRAGIALSVLVTAGQLVDRFLPGTTANIGKLENALLDLSKGEVTGELAKTFGDDLGKLAKDIERLASPSVQTQLDHFEDEIFSLGGLLGKAGLPLTETRERIEALDKALTSLASRDPAAARKQFEMLTEMAGLSGTEVGRLKGLLDGYTGALAEADTSQRLAGGSSRDLARAHAEQAEAIEAANVDLDDYTDKLRGMFDPIFGAQDALLDLREAQTSLAVATAEEMAARIAYTDAVARFGEGSVEAAEKAMELTAAEQSLDQATVSAARSTIDLAVAAEELRLKVANGGLSIADAKQKLFDMALAAGFSRDQAVAFSAAIDSQTFSVIGLANAINAIPTHKTVTIDMNVAEPVFNVGGGIKRRQHGGPVTAADVFLVGEKGPELFVPGSDGRVFTEQQVAAATGHIGRAPPGGGMGGSEPVKVQITLVGTGLLRNLRHEIRTDHGGNAQAALGQG